MVTKIIFSAAIAVVGECFNVAVIAIGVWVGLWLATHGLGGFPPFLPAHL